MEYGKEKALENKNKANKLLKEIAVNYKQNPKVLAEIFSFASNFYMYSPRNTQLIYSQNRGATYCQSFNDWKKMNAPVKKGEIGIKIWVPVQISLLDIGTDANGKTQFVQLSKATKEQKELYKSGKIKIVKTTRFNIGTVFDIAQTTFPKERYPELYSMGYSSDLHAAICKGIEDFSLIKLGCPVIMKDLKSISLRGCYNPEHNVIEINDKLEDNMRLSTTCHELGHALIHHSKNNKSIAQKEVEADALSIMLETNYGLELTESRQRHFAGHYNDFISELKSKVMKDNIDEYIDSVFEDVYSVYRDHIDGIENMVEKYIPNEKKVELDKTNRIAESNLQPKTNKKLKDKGIEL